MLDDTQGCDNNLSSFRLSSKINSILEHQVHRKSAARWARNLRFLTFDDDSSTDNVKHDGLSRRSKQGQYTRCELRVPPPAEHICAIHAQINKSDIKANETQLKEFADPCTHVDC